MLKVDNLNKSFKQNQVLKNINLELREGEILAIIGPSGAGKTTLLRCINGLERSDSGSIEIDGKFLCKDENNKSLYPKKKNVRDVIKNLGMVFQSYNLFPQKSALENVIEAPINAYKVSKKEAKEKAVELLSSLGLKDRVNSYPCELSGGEKQRVAIARACALSPKVMCFDEPTSALDPELTESVAKSIENLANDSMAVLIITHDMKFAERVADRIIFMENGEIIEEGQKDAFFNNLGNERIKKFIFN
ncbi:amino acid ABC transporter ATP-binding protein [Candidatus Clostridium stratigraminis]|uniref:Amino acid ABC transporter ATP-binding protein n=1 Tax=Candidatus Clostridium stratigraminis TaxID=3381661 RepID=A0ABW8SYN4_9CLOT